MKEYVAGEMVNIFNDIKLELNIREIKFTIKNRNKTYVIQNRVFKDVNEMREYVDNSLTRLFKEDKLDKINNFRLYEFLYTTIHTYLFNSKYLQFIKQAEPIEIKDNINKEQNNNE